jgi:hypothetical protein
LAVGIAGSELITDAGTGAFLTVLKAAITGAEEKSLFWRRIVSNSDGQAKLFFLARTNNWTKCKKRRKTEHTD